MSIESERLVMARKRAGYKTMTEASLKLGIPKGTYAQYENGLLGFHRHARMLAARLKVPYNWLMAVPGANINGTHSNPLEDLSPEEMREVLDFIEFIKAKRKKPR